MPHWTKLPREAELLAASTPHSVLLETARFDEENQRSYLFFNPLQIIAVQQLDDIPDLFRRIELALAEGHHVAGYLSYECGYHFERFDEPPLPSQLPLAWFGVYTKPFIFDHTLGEFEAPAPALTRVASPETILSAFATNAQLSICEDEYAAKIERIKNYIEAGDTYQVNFTDSVTAHTALYPADAFAALSASQPVSYSALINLGRGRHILSLSPELFFRVDPKTKSITTRPMKGTMPRALDLAEDEQQAARLASDEKNRSEHIMIVDLLRNDLGRICAAGSVRVDGIFSVERYATLLQMVSTVSGTLRPHLRWYDIFRALFPSGSITGAPKIRTMEIIRELESHPRGVYTGCVGHIAPDGSATFNVAIRTLIMQDNFARMGIGGGIVADSVAVDEYRECLLKASFLTHSRYNFQLIETMLCENGAIALLDLHLDRLEACSCYFDFPFDRTAARTRIEEAAQALPSNTPHRIRLLLDSSGGISLTSAELPPFSPTISVRIAAERTCSRDVFLRHKTTHREQYDKALAEAKSAGFDEVLFLNERNELTEGAISSLFIERDGKLLTPPLTSGALPGVYRRHILQTNPQAEERVLTLDDLRSADAIYLCNAVRGMRRVGTIAHATGR
jgi:para-aminobenzoate synthetase / 4-amino-4-deoxychorismate lyase